MPFITGVLTTVIQLLTGVGGLFLDIFFQKSMLDRKTTIATKAVTQTFSHVVRAVYFGSFVGIADAVPLWTYVPAIVLSIAGTTLAAQVLERMTDVGFRQWTRRVIFAVSAIYLVRGVMLLAESDPRRARVVTSAGRSGAPRADQRVDWLAHMMRAIHCTSSTESVRSL